MKENDLLKRIAIAKLKPDTVTDLQPRELAELVLLVLEYVKQVNKAIDEGKIRGEPGQAGKDAPALVPDVDYLSFPTAKAELDQLYAEVVSRIERDVRKALSQLRNGKDGRDGQDAVITRAQIEEAAKLAFELIELPDFRTLITQEPEAIRDSLELLTGDDRLDASAIKNLPEAVTQYVGAGIGVKEIQEGAGITIDNSSDGYPAVSAKGGGVASIEFIMDGGGSVLPTGIMGDLQIDFDCEIQSWTLLGDQSGSCEVDIWKDSFANFPPTGADSITGSSPPSLSSATKSTSSTLTGWNTTISSGDVLRFNINSVTSIQRLTLSLKVLKT